MAGCSWDESHGEQRDDQDEQEQHGQHDGQEHGLEHVLHDVLEHVLHDVQVHELRDEQLHDEQEQGRHGQREQKGQGRAHSPRGLLYRAWRQLGPGQTSQAGALRVNSRDLLSTIQHLHRHERPRDHNLLS